MKALRIVLRQSSANYKKEETIDNKMTYPLPPISTVIGAIHSACNYKKYHPMDVSIQGRFESMHKEPYTDYCFLNSTMDDRGILVKMRNESLLSKGFEKVATSKKQGSNMRTGVEIQVHNESLIKEYRDLKDLNDKIKDFKNTRIKKVQELIKKRKKTLASKKKSVDKKSNEFNKISQREKEIKQYDKIIKDRLKEYEVDTYSEPISKYRSLTTSLKFYEILNNIELIIHIKSDEENLISDILENIYNLKSIGRSEDFVDVVDAKIVTLEEREECDIVSEYSAYLNYDDVIDKNIYTQKVKAGQSFSGTKYYLNKNYEIKDNKRSFNKKKVLYASQYFIEETSGNVFVDKADDKEYIINFI